MRLQWSILEGGNGGMWMISWKSALSPGLISPPEIRNISDVLDFLAPWAWKFIIWNYIKREITNWSKILHLKLDAYRILRIVCTNHFETPGLTLTMKWGGIVKWGKITEGSTFDSLTLDASSFWEQGCGLVGGLGWWGDRGGFGASVNIWRKAKHAPDRLIIQSRDNTHEDIYGHIISCP